jgi:hypothetical protein
MAAPAFAWFVPFVGHFHEDRLVVNVDRAFIVAAFTTSGPATERRTGILLR